MNNIDKLRKKIDKIDYEILKLLTERSEIAKLIGIEKKAKNLFRPGRQAFILRRLLSNNKGNINPHFILAFWRSIFLSQIDIQGGIKIIMSKNIKDRHSKDIFDYFSHDIDSFIFKTLKKGIEKLKSKKNIFMIMPYPGNNRKSGWWTKKDFENLYVIASLPFFKKKNISPYLVIVSKYKPIINKENSILYLSKILIKEKHVSLEVKFSNLFLYKSDRVINNKNLKLFGVVPKNYEI